MCNLYRMTSNADAIKQLFAVTSDATPNLPQFDAIYPKREAPVVRSTADGGREITTMVWGFPPPPNARAEVTNVRNLQSPFWRSSLSKPEYRCLVPVTAFSEWTAEPDPASGKKRLVWFTLNEDEQVPFAFAGIWRPMADGPPRMAFLTCDANELVGAVHPKAMPVILSPRDYDRWMRGSLGEAVALARPYPAPAMHITP